MNLAQSPGTKQSVTLGFIWPGLKGLILGSDLDPEFRREAGLGHGFGLRGSDLSLFETCRPGFEFNVFVKSLSKR